MVATNLKTDEPAWYDVVEGLCRAFEGQELDEEFLARYDKTIEAGTPDGCCNYRYFMGTALDQQGRHEQAEMYWRRAAFGGPFENFCATLAGARLADRHGPERGGIPEELAKIDAEAAAQDEAAAKAAGDDKSNGEASEAGDEDSSI